MEQRNVKSGISVVGDIAWGTHLCLFYGSSDDLVDILVPYFEAGLENNELCVWVCWEPLWAQEARIALGKKLRNLSAYIAKEQIEIVDYSKRHTTLGKPGFDEMVHFWIEKEMLAFKKGFQGLRLTGNTSWLEPEEWADFMRYESEVDKVIHTHRMLAICPYSLEKCGAAEVMDVVSHHRFALIRRKDKWEVIRSAEEDRLQTALEAQMQNDHNSLDNSPLGIRIITAEGELLYANQAILDIYGYSSFEELKNTPTKQRYTPESYAEHEERKEKRRRGEFVPSNYGISIVSKDGGIRHLEVFRGEVLWNGEAQFQAIYQDITKRKQLEQALAEEKKRLEVTLRSTGDAVITTDMEGKVVLLNRVAEQLTGWTQGEAIGKPLAEVFHIIDEHTRKRITNPVKTVLKTGRIVGLINHAVLVSRDGSEYIIADSGAPIRDEHGNLFGVVLVFRDITEVRKLEEEIQKTEKLQSVGNLAGGIAHDFNNYLTGIMGNISLAKRYVEPQGKAIERLEEAEQASIRARDLTRQLLTFSTGGAPIKKIISIGKLIEDTVSFALRGSNIKPEFSLPDDLWVVETDEGQINQVISNIIINADQAMPQGGKVNVEAKNLVISRRMTLPLPRGNYVEITIRDYGVGIAKEHLTRIFEPFFTTKQKGSGLGLATSYSIIQKHGGHIAIESKLGAGTTVHVYLPASMETAPIREEVIAEAVLVGKGRILIMDDEEIIQQFLHSGLTWIGYEVVLTKDGAEAIECYSKAKESGQPFDAVIMDLPIPGGMGGKEAIKKLLEIDPDATVIVSSGYATDPIMADYRKYGFSAVATKPYVIEQLNETLYKLLSNKK
ncbi:PAS domain S-box protein [Chloroflexota bacterium]